MMKSLPKCEVEYYCSDLVLNTIRDVLKDVFGQKPFKKMLRIMRENYSLEWNDIPEKSQVFSNALRETLGLGSMIIEDLIVENLYLRLGLEVMRKKGFSFSDYISEIPSLAKTGSQQ